MRLRKNAPVQALLRDMEGVAMAVYFLRVKIFSTSRGSVATKAAAYRAGERIDEERSGDGYNNSHRQDLVAKDIVLASQLGGRTDVNLGALQAEASDAMRVKILRGIGIEAAATTLDCKEPKCRQHPKCWH